MRRNVVLDTAWSSSPDGVSHAGEIRSVLAVIFQMRLVDCSFVCCANVN